MNAPLWISSRDNAFVKDLKKLAHGSTEYRKQQRVWAEGDHLVRAAMARGKQPAIGIFSESFWPLAPIEYAQAALKNIVISDVLYDSISALESPSRMGFLFDMAQVPAIQSGVATVVLDRVQDAGNVGAILRSASAFGFKQIIAFKGSAALWSPKVLRAGMGAHWGLQLIEGADLRCLSELRLPLLVTSSHRGHYLHRMLSNGELPMPCVWALGHEGQGVGAELEALANLHVRIAQPGGEESLNVATAAAICLHASATAHLG
ncbi:23S rRNA (guanosine-2'-O-)-methyltransferase RlmB [Rhodoferax lithotrophicus]|uniref:23S rRNA (Guanosine-2'-O-)-methyltransferase RlmB n=1 Tax=Rhodoferax lithotrophicus TaxID=2798804 RepID=A0ABM7MNU6_9BURK|nr:RNA methyltransferase [Rhodoferax sp. MIZ03]BCO27989.1 23S rRNA (guanosine-2'-O-)-methyltransferase RlmB [Rhodoferax sp. MIZ03]